MKMIIEIWSDVVCPFCYIGKRRFESALSKFEHKDDIEVVWRSYQLYPSITSQPNKTIYEFMAEKNGITVAQIKEQYDFINEMATEVGLKYKLDKALLLNTKNAHQLLQLARTEKKDSDAEELLFQAYFIDNKNIDDLNVLEEIAETLGIDKVKLSNSLSTNRFSDDIENDIYQSKQIGVHGVPFFLMNNEISVQGAQEEQIFLESIKKAWVNWNRNLKMIPTIVKGDICSEDSCS